MADSLFQQAVDKVKEVLAPSGEQTTSSSANSQKNNNASTGASFDTGMMQSLLTAGMGTLSKEDQQKVQEFQQSFQSNTQSQFSPKNHNEKMDISGNVVSSAMNQLSTQEQQQLQQFQQTLGIESSQGNNAQQQMGMAQETGSNIANQTASQEKAAASQLAEELGGKM